MCRNNSTTEKEIRKILRRYTHVISARDIRETCVIYSRKYVFGSCWSNLVY